MFDDEDNDKLGDPDGDTQSEKLSQAIDNLSDKLDAPRCRVDMISLDEATNFLLRKGHEESNVRTQVRRLYATANVLSSLKLIEKIGCTKITDKPAMFQNLFLNFVLQTQDIRKPASRRLGMGEKPKGENGFTVYVIVIILLIIISYVLFTKTKKMYFFISRSICGIFISVATHGTLLVCNISI